MNQIVNHDMLKLMRGVWVVCCLCALGIGLRAEERNRLLLFQNESGEAQRIESRKHWNIKQRQMRHAMESVMGSLPDRSSLPPFEMIIFEELKRERHIRRTILFTADENDYLYAYLYFPILERYDKKLPVVLALHPTHPIGKGVVDGQSDRPNRAYGRELADRGYVVVAPDYPSFGQLAHYDFQTDGYVSGTMKGIFNHMRCLDLLETMPEMDSDRVGVIGHSLGGHNALFLAAFDPRIKAVVTSCGWTPFHDYYGGDLKGWTSDRYMPLIQSRYESNPDKMPFDFYEVFGSIAPRPVFSNSPLKDSNFDVEGVRKAEVEIRELYKWLGRDEHLRFVYPDAEHDFPEETREEAYAFLDAYLK